jgi:mycothiol synthase
VGYQLRPPASEDLAGVADVVVADELADSGHVTLGEDFVRREWTEPGFEPDHDGWVVVDPAGSIVGYAHVRRSDPDLVQSWGVVHPQHRGRGVGSALFQQIDQRATTLLTDVPAGRFRHAINAKDGEAAQILRAHGLRPVRHFWHMQIDLPGSVESGPSPAGISIVGVLPPDDLPVVHALLGEAFVDHWGDFPGPYDRWLQEETSNPGYDPNLWLLAKDGARPVGVLIATLGDDRGWVEYLAVAASHRGRGIAAALLRRSFASFAAQGVSRALVSVDAENATGATGVYERVGMHTVKSWDMWERP